MNSSQDELFKEIFEKKNQINSDTFTITRFLLLALNSYFIDGLQFRELKSALKISDGNLASNINYLIRMGYINKNDMEFDNKKLHYYTITDKGKQELTKILDWTDLIKKLLEEINDE
ncbi:MAG: transcriptional regulator [Candidatus Lokiarchaeota archaeon]|nr:transcriptional regulator [Candidatus Lokiarchaeota archaeon]